jgi:hypothetical protein
MEPLAGPLLTLSVFFVELINFELCLSSFIVDSFMVWGVESCYLWSCYVSFAVSSPRKKNFESIISDICLINVLEKKSRYRQKWGVLDKTVWPYYCDKMIWLIILWPPSKLLRQHIETCCYHCVSKFKHVAIIHFPVKTVNFFFF